MLLEDNPRTGYKSQAGNAALCGICFVLLLLLLFLFLLSFHIMNINLCPFADLRVMEGMVQI